MKTFRLTESGVNTFRLTEKSPSESDEGISLMQWKAIAIRQHPELCLLFHVPNGGAREIQTAARLKREGTVKGIPDYLLLCARNGYHGMALELKRRSGGVLSEDQLHIMSLLKANGYCAVVAHGWEKARDRILQYLHEDMRNE